MNSACLKRFRYKGDLSKHIRRYHPGHKQDLVPIPLQPDELATLQATVKKPPPSVLAQARRQSISTASTASTSTASATRTAPSATVTSETAAAAAAAAAGGSNSTSNKLFFPLLPQHPVKQSELEAADLNGSGPIFGNGSNNEELSLQQNSDDNNDPSLDENILNMLTEDEPGGLSAIMTSAPTAVSTSPPVTTSASILHDVLTRGAASAKPQHTSTSTTTVLARRPTTLLPPPPPPPASTNKTTFVVPSSLLRPQGLGTIQRTTASGIKFNLPTHPTTMIATATATTSSSSTTSSIRPPQLFRQTQSLQTATVVSPSTVSVASAQNRPEQQQQQQQQQQKPITMTIDEVLACVQPVPQAASTPVKTYLEVKLPTEPANISTAATSLLPTRPAKPFPCDHPGCNRSFEKATLLRRHQKLHSGNCKYVCEFCKKCFESQSKIDDHNRKHTGEFIIIITAYEFTYTCH